MSSVQTVFGIQLANIDKAFDDRINTIAKKHRAEQAAQILHDGPYLPSDETIAIVSAGFLQTIIERNPFYDASTVVAFNLDVTRKTCKAILDNENFNIIEKVAIYSCIVELGAREFISPNDASMVITYLGSAKEAGFFFTPPSVAIRMVLLSLEYSSEANCVFDPACGAGVFLAYHILLNDKLEKALGVEVDPATSTMARLLLKYVAKESGKPIEVEVVCKDFFDFFEENKTKRSFDLIVMNPPYGSIKFLATDLTDASTKTGLNNVERVSLGTRLRNDTIERASKLRAQFLQYGIGKGVLEYSKLFLAAAHALLAPKGFIIAITPSSWLGDESSTEFRKNLLGNGYLYELWLFPEIAKLFKGVNQPTVVSSIGKETSQSIVVRDDLISIHDICTKIKTLSLQSVLAVSGDKRRFPKCDEKNLLLLSRLLEHGRIKDDYELVNARGELDLTTYRHFLSSVPTAHRLVRGDHIDGWILRSAEASEKEGYVDYDAFCESISQSAKLCHLSRSRLAIAQCSYLQKRKRIEAAIVPEECVVANSCNYLILSTPDNDPGMLCYYWALINSSILEWQFRIFSYNNHVSNKEIDELVCIPFSDLNSAQKEFFLKMADLKEITKSDTYLLDAAVAVIFGLSLDEYKLVMESISADDSEKRASIFCQISETLIEIERTVTAPANHFMPSLSALDRTMISYIAPGENWTSIPESVPSKRLDQIRAMAKERGMVRTTYYSRLKHSQPAYTISTYYNRPGNGANIHPWEDRTLTSREAARLQSFPDSFIFEGNDASARTQIGNAVPPLLGYAIGLAIKAKMDGSPKFCDIFAGAGGLSYGLELAGYDGVAAIEINPAAAQTFARNHNPNIRTLVGDITDAGIQQDLVKTIRETISDTESWVLVGGPPCQGFSTAGYRNENDVRNKLVNTYLNLIAVLKPTVVVMENVPGILSMSGGAVISGVYSSLRHLGYICHEKPWIIDAEQYGVPQMRKRVIIVAARDAGFLPAYPQPRFSKCFGRRESCPQPSLFDAHYPITVGEALLGLPPLMPISKEYYPTNEKIDNSYDLWCKGAISTEELFRRR